jgi:signal transduction histidine kinase
MRVRTPGKTALRYGGGIAFTLLMIAGRLALNPWLGEQSNRHLVFLPTVMLVSWFAGLVPGLLSGALCSAALVVFYTHPARPTADVVLFFVIAVAIAGLVESRRRARARADAAAKAREQVLAIVAHDLRNPLTTIAMGATALAGDLPDAERRRRVVGTIQRSAHRMEKLIGDLVEATKLERGALRIVMNECDVATLLGETAEMFSTQASEKGLSIEVGSVAGGLTMTCDHERVLQVLGNLVGNALRFTPKGGRITLCAEAQADLVRFEVKDTGSGIRAEDLPHVFERYWTSDRTGAGLGLYIAESLVRAHGGEIGVHSEPGRGACFFFTLPRTAPSRREAAVSGPRQRRTSLASDR